MERVIRDACFDLVASDRKPDAKKRLMLGSAMKPFGSVYNIYRNRLGQILLDPVKAVLAYEAWLFENPAALASVKRGMADSAAGRIKDIGTFTSHANEGRTDNTPR